MKHGNTSEIQSMIL